MKRHLTIMLLVSLLLSALCGCGNSEPGQTETNVPAQTVETAAETETETTYLDTLGERDFEGASYVISAAQTGSIPAWAVEQTGEAVNDALYDRDLWVSEKYNVVIEYPEASGTPDTAAAIANSVLSGDFFSDLYIDCLSNGKVYMGEAFRKGALYNLLDVPHLQLDQIWWSQLLYDNLQYNGKMFFTSGDLATASYIAPACVYMNAAVAEDNDIDVSEVYQLVYDGAWTIDEMMKRTAGLKRDLNGDGVISPVDDVYGVIHATVELTSTEICVGAGIRYSEVDENGNLVVNLNTEEVINTLEKLKQFCEVKPSDDWSSFPETFKTDRTLFCIHFVQLAVEFREMESDFLILPMAKSSVEQESYMSYTNPYTHSYIAIPLIQPDIDRTGFITEALEYMSVEMVRPTIYDQTLKAKVSRDTDSAAMLDIIFDTTYVDFNTLNMFGGSPTVLNNALFADGDFVSEYKKIEQVINKELEEYVTFFN